MGKTKTGPKFDEGEDPIKAVSLSIVSVRLQGEEQDLDGILAQTVPILTRSKIFLDSNGLGADGEGTSPEDKAAPEDISWQVWYNGRLDLQFDGNGRVTHGGDDHFELIPMGMGKLEESAGHAVIIRLSAGSAGKTTAVFRVSHRGVQSNQIDVSVD